MFETIKITDAELDALPPGIPGFLAFESLCRTKPEEVLSSYGHNDDDTEPRHSYLTKVFSAAEHWNVPVLDEVDFEVHPDFGEADTRRLFRMIDKETNKLRLQTIRDRKGIIAVIEPPQATKIEHLISQLRKRIIDSEMEDRTKQKLYKNLDELLAIMKGKPTLQATMVVIASIFTAINQGQAAIIKLPDTISAIAKIFGHAQEDADIKALEHKPQRLIENHSDSYNTAPDAKPNKTGPRETYDLNDDIPF